MAEFLSLPKGNRMPASGSTLSREILLDKILGCLFGNAIGDAIGLGTYFIYYTLSK